MGEPVKIGAEEFLANFSKGPNRAAVLTAMKGGFRVKNLRLETTLAGLRFENPLMVGPGYDKQGRLVDALWLLNFAGTEVGSVPLFPQPGNPKPRLFINYHKGVALNRFGFNTVGTEKVAQNLAKLHRPGIVGISIGKNKVIPDEYAPWQYATAIEQLYEYGDYFVLCLSSPNTAGLRKLLGPNYLPQMIRQTKACLRKLGKKPLFVKTAADLALRDLDKVIEICINEGADGIVDTNTTINERQKMKYGWENEAGGLSGRDTEFRKLANDRMKHITKISAGSGLARIGVGGIYDAASALERLQAGAQVVQIVTAFLPLKPRLARQINKGILNYINETGACGVEELIGSSV